MSYYVYDTDNQISTYDTAEQAANAAQSMLDDLRLAAQIDGEWEPDVGNIAFGRLVLLGITSRTGSEADGYDYHISTIPAPEDVLRAKLKRAVELLHMLDRPEQSHPDVAAFLAEVGEP